MTPDKLKTILANHAKWLRGEGGEDADLARAYLTGANLTGANLAGANLADADLTRAYLTGANLTGAYLTGANLTGAYLTGANLTGAYLTGANLTGANLTGADLAGANLADADLARAYLTGANLTRANLARAYLTGANLTGAVGLPVHPDPIGLRYAVADVLESHPELHNQAEWGDGNADPQCGTPCCVAGWACHLGGGRGEMTVASAATVLLWADGHPMPSFDATARREDIIKALRS